jgi:hypothetical protein
MNAQTTIVAEHALQPVPNVREYAPSVWVHYPDEHGLRLTLRCDLMAFRDRATVGLMRCCAEASATLQEAGRLAGLYALANIPTKALFQMHVAARSLIDAASSIELSISTSTKTTSSGGNDAGV